MSDIFFTDQVSDAKVTLLDDGEWADMGIHDNYAVTAKALRIDTGSEIGDSGKGHGEWSQTSIAFTFRITPSIGYSHPVEIDSLAKFFQVFTHSEDFDDVGETTVEWSELQDFNPWQFEEDKRIRSEMIPL